MNPIALGMVALGILLFVLGLLLVARHRRVTGIAISLIGLGTLAAPFIITFFLFR
jgi:urea transporter